MSLLVQYEEEDLEASASLKWSYNGGESVLIPAKWGGWVSWEKPNRCFTTKDSTLYIIEFDRPNRTKSLIIRDMPKLNPKAKMSMLGTFGPLKWKQRRDGTIVIHFSEFNLTKFNAERFDALENAWVIKVTDFKATAKGK